MTYLKSGHFTCVKENRYISRESWWVLRQDLQRKETLPQQCQEDQDFPERVEGIKQGQGHSGVDQWARREQNDNKAIEDLARSRDTNKEQAQQVEEDKFVEKKFKQKTSVPKRKYSPANKVPPKKKVCIVEPVETIGPTSLRMQQAGEERLPFIAAWSGRWWD